MSHSISDPKYAGTRVSRGDLKLSEDEDEEMDSDGVEQEEESDEDTHDGEEHAHEDSHSAPRESSSYRHTPEKTHDDSVQQERGRSYDLASTLRATREQDRKKGRAVIRQIVS